MRGARPRDDPRAYFAAFVVLLATSVAFPDGFFVVSLGVGVVVVVVSIALAATDGFRRPK